MGTEPPVVAVLYADPAASPDPVPWDSGLSVLFSDAPEDGRELEHGDERIRTACVHCLVDHFPEVGRGFDLAREHGEADRDTQTGEWTAGSEPKGER